MARHVNSDIFRVPQRPRGKDLPPARLPARPKPLKKVSRQPSKLAAPRVNKAGDDGAGEADDVRPHHRRSALGQVPAWVVSMLVHVVALLVMALIVGEVALVARPTVITSPPSENEPEDDPVEIPKIDDAQEPEDARDPVPDVTMVADGAPEIPDLSGFPSEEDFVPPAPHELAFSDKTAPLSDMLAIPGGRGANGPAGDLAGQRRGPTIGTRGVTPGGELAVDRALKWIVLHQMPDGGWSFDLAACPSCMTE